MRRRSKFCGPPPLPASYARAPGAACGGGDTEAAVKLANWYKKGEMGLTQNSGQAFRFFMQAAKADHPTGMGRASSAYFYGVKH